MVVLSERLEGKIFRSLAGSSLRIAHQHAEIEFNLVTKGGGAYIVEGKRHELRPGTIIWLLPGQFHELVRDPALEFWAVQASPVSIDEHSAAGLEERPLRTLTSTNALALERLLALVSQDTDEPAMFNAGIEYAFQRALHGGTQDERRNGPVHPAVSRALLLLESHEGPDTLEELSAACGLAPAHLSRLLKQHSGCGFVALRNRARLQRFALIHGRNGDIGTAATEAGFGSLAQFYRIFRAATGQTPSEWAAEHGGAGELLAKPVAQAADAEMERGDVRWYELAGIALSPAREALHDGFIGRLFEDVQGPPGPISVPTCPDRFAANQLAFGAEYAERDPRLGAQFRQLTRTHDVLASYRWLADLYEADPADLATAVSFYLQVAHMAVHSSSDVDQAQGRALMPRVRAALKDCGPLLMSDGAERQMVAEAFIHQGVIVYHAVLAVRGSGNPWLLRWLGEVTDRAAAAIFKQSLRSFTISKTGTLSPIRADLDHSRETWLC